MMFDQIAFPAHSKSRAFVEALFELLEARAAFEEAKKNVPDYTGQYEPRDYYAVEEERFNRASDAFAVSCGVVSADELSRYAKDECARINVVKETDLPVGPSNMHPVEQFWRVTIDGSPTAQRYRNAADAVKDGPRQRAIVDEVNASIARSVARRKQQGE